MLNSNSPKHAIRKIKSEMREIAMNPPSNSRYPVDLKDYERKFAVSVNALVFRSPELLESSFRVPVVSPQQLNIDKT